MKQSKLVAQISDYINGLIGIGALIYAVVGTFYFGWASIALVAFSSWCMDSCPKESGGDVILKLVLLLLSVLAYPGALFISYKAGKKIAHPDWTAILCGSIVLAPLIPVIVSNIVNLKTNYGWFFLFYRIPVVEPFILVVLNFIFQSLPRARGIQQLAFAFCIVLIACLSSVKAYFIPTYEYRSQEQANLDYDALVVTQIKGEHCSLKSHYFTPGDSSKPFRPHMIEYALNHSPNEERYCSDRQWGLTQDRTECFMNALKCINEDRQGKIKQAVIEQLPKMLDSIDWGNQDPYHHALQLMLLLDSLSQKQEKTNSKLFEVAQRHDFSSLLALITLSVSPYQTSVAELEKNVQAAVSSNPDIYFLKLLSRTLCDDNCLETEVLSKGKFEDLAVAILVRRNNLESLARISRESYFKKRILFWNNSIWSSPFFSSYRKIITLLVETPFETRATLAASKSDEDFLCVQAAKNIPLDPLLF